MIAYVYVEGESDRLALEALWRGWRDRLRAEGKGIKVLPLDDKTRFLKKIGAHAAARLLTNASDLVVGLPDLYPNEPYSHTQYAHPRLSDLIAIQEREVRRALENDGAGGDPGTYMNRFFATALKHDLEMLLLAAERYLAQYLKCSVNLGNWRRPVEDQNHARPPKRVVEEIFRSRSPTKSAYRDTVHASAVLGRVPNIGEIFYTPAGQLTCPEFKRMVDWLGGALGLTAY